MGANLLQHNMHRNKLSLLGILLFLSGSMSCAGPRFASSDLTPFFTPEGPFGQHFCGFVLYDPMKEKYIHQINGDKYFTPASNTKIFTLYAALLCLEDSLATARLVATEDTLYIWGLGDPTFQHPLFQDGNSLIDEIIRFKGKNLVVCQNHFQDSRFGSGWAWDDYDFAYQLEKSALPIYGNRILIQLDSATQSVYFHPPYAEIDLRSNQDFAVARAELENHFQITYSHQFPNWQAVRSLHQHPSIIKSALTELTNKPIEISQTCPVMQAGKLVYSTPVDTVYRRLMHHSDNFIAEQLLLQIAGLKLGIMNTTEIIESMTQKELMGMPDPLLWVDGSGLSRYNMFTPRSICEVLKRIYDQLPTARIFDIFPAGGKSGTLKDFYPADPPFIYAKTGTLRNKHCLSGYLLTDSGKTLIFSFMHNNFPGVSASVKSGMDRVLRHIKSQY